MGGYRRGAIPGGIMHHSPGWLVVGMSMSSSEIFYREIKAQKLAAYLYELRGVTAEMVLSTTETDWANIAKRAGCNPPNPKNPKPTVDAVVAALERMYLDGGPEPKSAQQESDEASAADEKAEGAWLDKQMMETGNERTPRT